MLKLYNHNHSLIGNLADFEALYHYIIKKQACNPEDQAPWKLTYYQHSELCILYGSSPHYTLTAIEAFALNNGIGLIILNQGHSLFPVQVPLMPGMDIDLFIHDWCKKYCAAHNLLLISADIMEGEGNDLVI